MDAQGAHVDLAEMAMHKIGWQP
jgi:hypothetical protein